MAVQSWDGARLSSKKAKTAIITMTIFLPILLTGPQFGVAVPQYDVPAGIYYNYAADDCLLSDRYWPMVWSADYPWGKAGPECAGRTLLLLNEPEMHDQADMTPDEGAALLWEWQEWSGQIYCCGNGYDSSGLAWFVEMMGTYTGTLPIDGIHIHTYAFDTLDRDQLRKWRALADSHGWQIVVTEIGLFPTSDVTPQDVAEALPDLLDTVRSELNPAIIFWFALRIHSDTLFGGMRWDKLTLLDYETGRPTVVGEAWTRYTGWGYQRTSAKTQ